VKKVIYLAVLSAFVLGFSGCESKSVSRVDALVKRVKDGGVNCQQLGNAMDLVTIADKELVRDLASNKEDWEQVFDKVCKK
jgi:hypothetical protein